MSKNERFLVTCALAILATFGIMNNVFLVMLDGRIDRLESHAAPVSLEDGPQRLAFQDCEDVHRFANDSMLFHCADGTIIVYDADADLYYAVGNWDTPAVAFGDTTPTYRPRPIPSTWELLCPCSYYQGDPL